jgi:4-diphosphocytidyl-2-C-methyl-D-erythritol kinase
LRASAPAKINLWLRVLGRRADGFHDLDTLFQAVDLSDEVEVVRRGSGVALSVEGPDLGPIERNLAFRAARAFFDRLEGGAGAGGVEIRLRKRIPAGAGLGGGSSDAGAVLRCLDRMWSRPFPPGVLAELGGSLGSDVPFFLGRAALARGRGRGELLDPLPPLPEGHLVLVLPPVHVATGPAYGALARARGAHSTGPAAPPLGFPATWTELGARAVNDFETVVPGAHPQVAASLEALREAGAWPALLSGSGGACFGFVADRAQCEHVAGEVSQRLGWPAVPARTLDRLPEPRPF